MTNISWTDESWNPVTGCTPVSEGCAHCYAKTMTHRFDGDFSKVTLHPDRLGIPLHWRKPRTVFTPSMGDLFHEDVPDEFIGRVWNTMNGSRRHTFQVLTKRPERMRSLLLPDGKPRFPTPHNHIWLGVSVENQARADERIPLLLETPAAMRFVSAEPLLGPLELGPWLRRAGRNRITPASGPFPDDAWYEHPRLDWVIVGGESGPGARLLVQPCECKGIGIRQETHDPNLRGHGPARPTCYRQPNCMLCGGTGWRPKPEALGWVRDILAQCEAAGVPAWFKQWGPRAGQGTEVDGREHKEMP